VTVRGTFTFLMCSERSGSNLLSRMFDAHPRICAPTPAHLVRLLGENRHQYGDPDDLGSWRRLLTDAADLLATTVGPWRTTWTVAALETAAEERSLGGLLRGVLRAEAAAAGKTHLFLKENHLHRYLGFVQREFPGLRLVSLVRDPRDMALSWKRSPILRGDVVRAARVWRQEQTALARLLARREPDLPIHLLTYEDLVSDPAGRLAEACAFLDLPFAPSMLDFHASTTAQDHASRSDDWRNVARPVMGTNFGKWRDGLTATEAAYVERICARPMAYFGYGTEIRDPHTLAELEAVLVPRERHDKPGWARVPAVEKRVRSARQAVVRRVMRAESGHA
jgi:hypothetical protein